MHDNFSLAELRHLIPENMFGEVQSITPIHMGLSGAAVHSFTATTGEFILRLQGDRFVSHGFTEHLTILRRAAAAAVAPQVVFVDEDARAIVVQKIQGHPLPAALGDPVQRVAAIADIVSRLRTLHSVETTGIGERDPLVVAREMWSSQSERPGFPPWARGIGNVLDRLASLLGRDPRLVFSHNDVNPSNVMWDGTRTWLIDWDAAGLTHPYYDLAALTTFLNMDDEPAALLLEKQEGSTLSDDARITFAALRQLVPLFAGLAGLSLVTDLTTLNAPAIGDAPTLAEFYSDLRLGKIDLRSPRGPAQFGLALLRRALS